MEGRAAGEEAAEFPLRLNPAWERPAWGVPVRAELLKKRWLLFARFGIELGLTCRFVELKLARDGDTGFAPVMTLA